ncbi:MAG: hypothetical protein ACXVXQ_06570 [Mycobacteriaceae bacterium]
MFITADAAKILTDGAHHECFAQTRHAATMVVISNANAGEVIGCCPSTSRWKQADPTVRTAATRPR